MSNSDWLLRKIGDVALTNTDTYSPKEEWEYVNYLDTGNINQGSISSIQMILKGQKLPSRARRKIEAGDIVYSTVRPNQRHYGFIVKPLDNMIVSTGFAVIRGKDNQCDTKFLYYFLTQNNIVELLQTIAEQSTSAYPSIRPSDIESLNINLPPLPEQKAIARILSSLDDKIELNQQMNQTLEAIARAIFKSWFVDFDPVRAKMEGKQPVGMDTATAKLFPDSFEESALGLIPRGWKVGTIGDVIDIFDSKRIPLSNKERLKRQGNYPYYGAASVMDYVDDYIFDGIYILMGEDGSVIDSNGFPIIQYAWGKFWVNNHAHVLKGSNSISDEHLMLFLKQTNISAYVTGAVQPKVNQGNLKRIPFIIPNHEISEYFSKQISPLYGLLRANTEQSQTLANIRDTLLPKLMSGEIRVKEAERIIEEVV